MNNFKQFFIKASAVSNGFRTLYRNTIKSENGASNRLPVRTPFRNVTLDRNVLQSKWYTRNNSNDFNKKLQSLIPKTTSAVLAQRDINDIASAPKKRPGMRKKRSEHQEKMAQNGYFSVIAYATAEEYDLEKLKVALIEQDLYQPKKFCSSEDNNENEPDVLYVTAKYKVGDEPREIYFFREGTVVMWNISDMESSNVLAFLKKFEQDSYDESIVQNESEMMYYNFTKDHQLATLRNNNFYVTKSDENNMLEKYTFSNAMSLSVKLGIWEASLEDYVDSMAYVTEDLKQGNKFKITRPEMLRKTGELFALRHLINLSSDLLDTPDFYWDREQLENLYSQTINYFSISKRTRVMNEKLNHCVELADLITSNLNDIHHVRLEKIIIYLIMIEVGFEIVHYAERYYGS